jgi:hypothetical protein
MPVTRITKTSAHAGMYARQLAMRLADVRDDPCVSYADLSELFGMDVQERRDLLTTARDLVRREHGIVYDVVHNEGLTRLTSPGMLGYVDGRLQRVQRASHKVKAVLDCVQPTDLNTLERHRWLAQQSVIGAVAILTHSKTVTQIAAGDAPPALPFDMASHQHAFT